MILTEIHKNDALLELFNEETANLEMYDAHYFSKKCTKEELINAVIYNIHNTKAQSESLGTYIKELQERKEALDARVERDRNFLKTVMSYYDLTKISTPLASISLRDNPNEKLEVKNEDALYEEFPELFTPSKPKLDKAKLKEYLQQGVVTDNAELVKGNKILSIR